MQLLFLMMLIAFTATARALFLCENKRILSTTYVGEDHNVRVERVQCSNIILPQNDKVFVREVLGERQSNVCGATYSTNCFPGAGGGPDPNECHVIADALLYDSQNIGPTFDMDPAKGTSLIVMTYRSCESFIVNQTKETLQYCRTDWSNLVSYIAPNCQATQNAHGGNCVASDQRWFVQVQHS
ncbi:hypothetical protein EWM64_g4857 [Hericium alpestre]|uniref:Uncharacterized protein n=1 Tax=Hericium alpestre TaxID=135208 RepID=A0A4Y9ZY80_9AGAM|nr:hypothetical protein EWM64_g4857 [Hericium alpestre]